MTITILMVDADEVTGLPEYTAQQFRQAQAATHGGGSGRQLGGRSGFRVGTPSNVLTATSTTWTLGPCAAMLDPGATTHQGMYGWSTDANEAGAVTAADDTNPRKDIIYIQVNDDSAGDGSGLLSAPVLYAAGTPGVTPVAPAVGEPGRERSFLVGTITVPQVGGGDPSVVLNPAWYVAAGGILPVANDAERLTLTIYEGLRVDQLDIDRTYRHNGSRWAQSVDTILGRGALGAVTNLAGTPSWTTIATVTATSMGGEVLINWAATLINANSGDHRTAAIRVQCDGVNVDSYSFFQQYIATANVPTFPGHTWWHTPAAGTHTWTLQGNANVPSAIQAVKGSMVVTERP